MKRKPDPKRIIFINDRIRQSVPDGPVVRLARGKSFAESDTIKLLVGGKLFATVKFRRAGHPGYWYVKSWVTLEEGVQAILAGDVKHGRVELYPAAPPRSP